MWTVRKSGKLCGTRRKSWDCHETKRFAVAVRREEKFSYELTLCFGRHWRSMSIIN